MRRFWNIALCILGLMASTACSEDGECYPPIITDLVVVETDAQGMVETVRMDHGERFPVHQALNFHVADSSFRCMASYTQDAGKVTFFDLVKVFSQPPYPVDDYYVVVNGVVHHDASMLPRHPVKVISMWRSGGYINMHLGVKTAGMGWHQYGFCEDSVHHYWLLHQRPAQDGQAYTEQVYLSMPIPEEEERLTFSIHTDEGVYTQVF